MLHVACEVNDLAVVRYLIEEVGLSQTPDEHGYYPLHSVLMHEHTSNYSCSETILLLNYLVEHGAEVDIAGPFNRSPLHTATLYGCLPGVMWLIALNANINRVEKGRFQANTPLHNAAFGGYQGIVEFLLLKGVNARLVNKSGLTPLMEGIQQGHLAVAETFWKHGHWLSAGDYEQLLKKPLTAKAKRCLEVPLRTRLTTSVELLTERDIKVQLDSLTTALQQKGWNCFDVAVGIEREQIVKYALENSANLEFRRLLAPEIKHAAALSGSHGLPSSMRTTQLSTFMKDYFDAHEAMKKAVEECNEAIGKPERHRLSLEDLEKTFFVNPNNKTQYAVAYQKLCEAREQLFTPAEQRFNEYCENEESYKTYIRDYYGASQWFAFQRQVETSRSTSMVDITAHMLKAQIVIHNCTDHQVIYETAAYGPKVIHVDFNGVNHFTSTLAPDAGVGTAPVAEPIIFSQGHNTRASMVPSEERRVVPQPHP